MRCVWAKNHEFPVSMGKFLVRQCDLANYSVLQCPTAKFQATADLFVSILWCILNARNGTYSLAAEVDSDLNPPTQDFTDYPYGSNLQTMYNFSCDASVAILGTNPSSKTRIIVFIRTQSPRSLLHALFFKWLFQKLRITWRHKLKPFFSAQSWRRPMILKR